ncbi:MAG: DUF2125 domain-containing protein [Albidovulum sp.]|nr:DUF2125 domain-containing protein [Albidovulum sp.]
MKFISLKALTAAILLLGLGWSAYWLIGGRIAKAAVEDRLRRESSLDIRYSDISVSGFPNRFDFTIANPEIADSRSRTRWTAPFIQILSLSYDWSHLIAVWPETQAITFGDEEFIVDSSGMKASFVFERRPDSMPERFALEFDRADVLASDRAVGSFSGGVLAVERVGTDAEAYRIGIAISEAEFDSASNSGILNSADTTLSVSDLSGDIRVHFDGPPRSSDFHDLLPYISEITFDSLNSSINGLDLSMDGGLEFAPSGYPVGELAVELEHPALLAEIAVAHGLATREEAAAIVLAVSSLLSGGSRDEAILIPILFENGAACIAISFLCYEIMRFDRATQ